MHKNFEEREKRTQSRPTNSVKFQIINKKKVAFLEANNELVDEEIKKAVLCIIPDKGEKSTQRRQRVFKYRAIIINMHKQKLEL